MAKRKKPEDTPKKAKGPVCKLMKMVSGETILAEFKENADSYQITYPLKIVHGSIQKGEKVVMVFGFSKWIENTLQNIFVIPKSQVLVLADPDKFTHDKYLIASNEEQILDGGQELDDITEETSKPSSKNTKKKKPEINLDDFDINYNETLGEEGDDEDWDADGGPMDHNSRFTI